MPPAVIAPDGGGTPAVELATGCPVTADVRGNLGPASVVTSAVNKDWLKDRWQAAANMAGAPLAGPHTLVIDLGRPCRVARAEVDFEDAHASLYDIELSDVGASGPWRLLRSVDAKALEVAKSGGGVTRAPKHVVHRFETPGQPGQGNAARWVRLRLRTLATMWGVSVWRVQLWGSCAA